ncbi:MAG: 2-oxoacid:ferredoxin oxidoreductase subunit beta [Armatimonadota bacterium]|nr:2-oxoacid:ferredoxin oxidoreductase subunit beta [Armatimonadota bacterium]
MGVTLEAPTSTLEPMNLRNLEAPPRGSVSMEQFESLISPDWCPGCGDFGVLKALKMSLVELNIAPHNVMVVSGIGCSSNLPGFIHANGVHSLHGRALPVAQGIHLANTKLKVIAVGGDGDGYGIGMGHFVHAMRRNFNLTYIVMDNQIYGLTTGQTSPTSSLEFRTKTTPRGNAELPINPLTLAVASGASFVARCFSGEPAHMAKTMTAAIAHRGFALVDVFSPCVTYNKVNTYPFFKERVYTLEDEGHDPTDMTAAFERTQEFGPRIPLGIFYKKERPTYEDSDPVLDGEPLVDRPLGMDQQMFDELIAETI